MALVFNMVRTRLFYSFIGVVLAFFAGTSALWAQEIKGRVLDAETGESMPGVAIQYNQSLNQGVVSDNNGYFTIPSIRKVQKVVLSFIGYTTATYGHEDLPRNGSVWIVKLQPETAQLQEVEVHAGVNPALRIVRNAISNRNGNNPRKYPNYKYVSYNKNVITYRMDLPDTVLSKKDSLQFAADTLKAQNRHMLVIESVTRKYFKEPNLDKEIVVGTKISGFKHPNVATTPDGIQNFAFHENIIPLVNKKYLNPLANGADKRYVYILKDTLYDGADTIFVMDYFPEKGANFEGFKGEMSIHTRKWALVHVTAYPHDVGKINIYLEQYYAWVQNYWFPVQLNFELELEKVPLKNTGAVMIGKTHLDSIFIGMPIDDAIFNHIQVQLLETATLVDQDFWDQHRNEELSIKEVETYQQMDSIGDRYKLDAVLDATSGLYDGFLVIKKIDVEYSKFLAYNQAEGWRWGLGLYTNDKISKKYRVGGYFGYGTKDENWKYGGKFYWYFNKPDDFYLTASFINDLRDPGGIRLRYSEWANVAQQFFNRLMDKVVASEISLSYRPATYSKLIFALRQINAQPANYQYVFHGAPLAADGQQQVYNFTEVQLNYRWQYKEKFSTNWGQRITQGSKWPIFSLIYSRGIAGVFSGDFAYNKVEAGINYTRYTRNLGKTRIQLEGGIVDRSVPWSMNFSGRPSFNPSFSVVVTNTFQTMRFNEFSSDKYFALFFMHDFGPLLLRFKTFKPEIRIFQGITYGTLSNPELHEGVPFKTLEEGFFESGLVIDNILRFNILNTGYLGIGAGVFYRYGANHFYNEMDNFTFKIAFMYSVN